MTTRRLLLSRIDAPPPVGPVLLACDGCVLVGLDFGAPERRLWPLLRARFGPGVMLEEADPPPGFAAAIRAYFAGRFAALDDVPADSGGTSFQRRAWAALRDIPPGETRSYGDLAAHLGHPRAARAVGLANALNPISLVVPCHRLVGRAGGLTGYGGGLERKRWLLVHESAPSHLTEGEPPLTGHASAVTN